MSKVKLNNFTFVKKLNKKNWTWRKITLLAIIIYIGFLIILNIFCQNGSCFIERTGPTSSESTNSFNVRISVMFILSLNVFAVIMCMKWKKGIKIIKLAVSSTLLVLFLCFTPPHEFLHCIACEVVGGAVTEVQWFANNSVGLFSFGGTDCGFMKCAGYERTDLNEYVLDTTPYYLPLLISMMAYVMIWRLNP